jgi:RNA polymerase sigma factor (sigma-70 family)
MAVLTDNELLRLLTTERRDEALGQIVERYTDMVYASALRQLNDRAAAEDVTQAVFIALWNKSKSVRDPAALPAWLLSATRLASLEAIKRKTIRTRYETEASTMPNHSPAVDYNSLAAVLDEALSALPDSDRAAIAMRFLIGQSFGEVAESLGVSADAAKKRVSRALERLRGHLAKRGLTSPADVLETSLATLAMVHAPPALVPAIHAACHGSASATVLALSKRIYATVLSTGVKAIATAVALAMMVTGGLAVAVMTTTSPITQNAATPKPATQPTVNATQRSDAKVYFIGGGVQRPGVYALNAWPADLLDAVFSAALDGDVNLNSAQLVLIRPTGQGTKLTARYSLRDLMDGKIDTPMVQTRDTVEVIDHITPDDHPAPDGPQAIARGASNSPTQPFPYVLIGGDVKRPGTYRIANSGMVPEKLIVAAGGTKNDLSPDKMEITLIRPQTGSKAFAKRYVSTRLQLNSHLMLQRGDILLVAAIGP